jgi:hypothetical protein
LAILQRAHAEHEFGIKLSAGTRRLAARKPDRLAECFESLGEGCELGNVQNYCGIDPQTLFRFSALGSGGLKPLFGAPAGILSGLDDIRVFPHRVLQEWWIGYPALGFYYHSGKKFQDMEAPEVRRLEVARLAVLVPRFLEELQSGNKIFVRFEPKRSIDDIKAVFRALHRHNGHTLLWIDSTESPSQAGEVQILERGLARGFVLDRATDAAPEPAALSTWLTLLAHALRMLRPEAADALQQEVNREPLPSLRAGAPLFCDPLLAVSEADDGPPEPLAGEPVMRHRLRVHTLPEDGAILSIPVGGMKTGALYTASASVWAPAGFDGRISLGFEDSPAVHSWPAAPAGYGRWQRIVTSVRSTIDLPHQRPGLLVDGPAGSEIFTTDWRLSAGVVPGR